MDDPILARLRLHLRGERALGLQAVAIGDSGRKEPAVPVAPEPQPTTPQPTADWFGNPQQPMAVDPSLTPAFIGPALPTAEKQRALAAMDENEVRGCTKCRLCERRTQTVFGEGDADARIFFIGEGPGETEDRTGRPFVGRAGELLNKMIIGMGLRREQVYIANIVKCRPPDNRVPAPDEVATCTPYLERQLEIIRPRVIVTLGLPATQYMLQTKLSMGRLRGQWQSWRGVKLMPTYHPAYVLRNPTYQTRAAVWSDLKQVLAELGMPVPEKAEEGGR